MLKQRTAILLIVVAVLLAFSGPALAEQLSGQVTAVNPAKGTLTLKSEHGTFTFDCKPASLIREVKVTDKVNVQYNEVHGKKIAVKVTLKKKRVSVGC